MASIPTALTVHSFTPPPVCALEAEDRIHLRAARMWVMLARHQRNPRPVLASLLGGTTTAFCLLMEQLVRAWPDAFTSFPPCASAVSPDEATLLGLLGAARADAPVLAERLLADMLPRADRARIWGSATRCVLPSAPF